MPLKHTVEEIILSNGIKGLIIDVPDSTVVSYDIHFRAGAEYIDKSIEQTPHLMEHLAFGPNEKFATGELFSQEFSKNGASWGATTWEQNMSYFASSAIMEWDRILDLVKLSITKPRYNQSRLESEKGNVREEMTGYANDHGRVLWTNIWRSMGNAVLTDPESLLTIDRVRLSDIEAHHKKTHTLKNMRFTFSGDLLKHKDEIIEKLSHWELPSGSRLPLSVNKYKSAPVVYIYRKDLPIINFGLNIVLGRELSRLEQSTMGALTHILAGTFHSRIFGKARSLGICYSLGSNYFTSAKGMSSWNVSGRVGVDNSEALFNLICDQLNQVINGEISNEELESAKQFGVGAHQMRCQTVGSLRGWYSSDYFFKETIDPLELSPEYIKAVTLEDIVKLAKEFIDNRCWTLGGIGDISKEQLQSHYDLLASNLFNGFSNESNS